MCVNLTWWDILYGSSSHIHLPYVYGIVLSKKHFTCKEKNTSGNVETIDH